MFEGARTYTQVASNATSKLAVPATLIIDFKSRTENSQGPLKAAHQARAADTPATLTTFSKEALKAAEGKVTRFRMEDTPRKETKAPTREIVQDDDGSTRMVVTFYGSDGQPVLTIPPKESLSSAVSAPASHFPIPGQAEHDENHRLLNEAA